MTTATDPQPTLWDEVRVIHHRPTAEEAFAQFCRRTPEFMRAIAARSYELANRGNTRLSMKLLFEEMRYGDYPKIDNSWTALATRRLIEDHPDLAHLFVTRKRRGE